MAANTVNLISALSTFASGVSTANTTSELLNVIKAVSRVGSANLVYSYANTLPTANSTNMGMTGYVDNDGLYICDGTQWYALANTYVNTWSFGGSNYGYSTGGNSSLPIVTNIIDKFPFASDANATDVGDLISTWNKGAGQSSTEYGYQSGGDTSPAAPYSDTIQKFSFATDGNASDVGNLTAARRETTGTSSSDYGYTMGGMGANAGPGTGRQNVIDKFPFAADADATDVGDLTEYMRMSAGQSSGDYGYSSGGNSDGTDYMTTIQKFPFASDANATDVGDLTVGRQTVSGQSSSEYGYTSGGGYPYKNEIDKFPFASDGTATDVGDLTAASSDPAGQSSTSNGYAAGGTNYPVIHSKIDKFSFTSDGNAANIGSLTVQRYGPAGQQY